MIPNNVTVSSLWASLTIIISILFIIVPLYECITTRFLVSTWNGEFSDSVLLILSRKSLQSNQKIIKQRMPNCPPWIRSNTKYSLTLTLPESIYPGLHTLEKILNTLKTTTPHYNNQTSHKFQTFVTSYKSTQITNANDNLTY